MSNAGAMTMSQGSICDAAGHTIYFSIALIDAAEAEQVPAQQNDGAPGAELLGTCLCRIRSSGRTISRRGHDECVS